MAVANEWWQHLMSLPLLFPWPASLITRPTENGSIRPISNTLTNKIKLKPTAEQRPHPMGRSDRQPTNGRPKCWPQPIKNWRPSMAARRANNGRHIIDTPHVWLVSRPFVMYPRMRGCRRSCDLHPPDASCLDHHAYLITLASSTAN